MGRLEIDLVARRGSLLVIVEVRTRTTDRFGGAEESIDRAKQQRIRRAATGWLQAHPELRGCRLRFDAAGVLLGRSPGAVPQIDYYPDAF